MKFNIPDIFDPTDSMRYVLSVRIHPLQFSFALFDPVSADRFYFQPITNDKPNDTLTGFKEVLFENEFFTLPYQNLYIVNHTPAFTFVPSSIFSEKDIQTYMDFNFSKSKGKILHQEVKNPEITILHTIPEEIYQFIIRSMQNPKFIHHLSPLISYFKEKIQLDSKHSMIINLRDNGFDMICFSHGLFILANHFDYLDVSDIIYYILFTWKQMKFDQASDFIYLIEHDPQTNILSEELKKYIKNIVSLENNQTVPFELSALQSCEL